MKLLRRLFREESGQSVLIFVLAITVLCGFSALAVDYGTAVLKKSSLQNALDAACLAAAADLPDTGRALSAARDYLGLNGFEPTEFTVTFSDGNRTVHISRAEEEPTFFARVLGYGETGLSVRAGASKGPVGGAFSYALFSGDSASPLSVTGSSLYIGGSAHSNQRLELSASQLIVTGGCEAVSSLLLGGTSVKVNGTCQGTSVTTNGTSISLGSVVRSAAPIIEMPDLAEAIRSEAVAAGHIYTGDRYYSGTNIQVDGSVYVNGNITIGASSFAGNGCIFATGNITISGSGVSCSAGSSVCIYSQYGNITVTGSSITVQGILYAPKGTVLVTGSDVTVNGRVIGKKLGLYASNFRIFSGDDDRNCLPPDAVALVE